MNLPRSLELGQGAGGIQRIIVSRFVDDKDGPRVQFNVEGAGGYGCDFDVTPAEAVQLAAAILDIVTRVWGPPSPADEVTPDGEIVPPTNPRT